MSEPQPIETAPKDGSPILLFWESGWSLAKWGQIGFSGQGWVCILGTIQDFSLYDASEAEAEVTTPTLWMPAPPVPAKS
jgi:hypothetical protein